MTPFMIAVREVLDGGAATPGPAVSPSVTAPVPAAADAQVAIRSLAEQLTCEANAVLREAGQEVISLADECGPGTLAFTLGFGGRRARLRTDIAGREALASLDFPGHGASGSRQLASEQEMRELILSLIAA